MQHHFFKLVSILMLSFSACANEADVSSVPKNIAQAIQLPKGFKIDVFADLSQYNQLSADSQPRIMAFDAAGNLYVSLTQQGKVVKLEKNKQNPAQAGQLSVVAEGLNAPHGLTFVGEKLYVANQDSIVALDIERAKPPVVLVKDLPTGGHTLKSIKLGPDGYLYVNVGSTCNVCVENDPMRATILRYTVEGEPAGALTTLGRHAPSPIYATGLRNSQGFAWHPKTKTMFATNNGADNRTFIKGGAADDGVPPEHLNQIEAGRNYGWPTAGATSTPIEWIKKSKSLTLTVGECCLKTLTLKAKRVFVKNPRRRR